MAFDPDAYLATKAPAAPAGGNPIAVSAGAGAPAAFDPDAYLKDQGVRAFTGPEAFGIEAQNLFGARRTSSRPRSAGERRRSPLGAPGRQGRSVRGRDPGGRRGRQAGQRRRQG